MKSNNLLLLLSVVGFGITLYLYRTTARADAAIIDRLDRLPVDGGVLIYGPNEPAATLPAFDPSMFPNFIDPAAPFFGD